MALDLFCYTSLEPDEVRAALKSIRLAGAFDYEADFVPSVPISTTEDLQAIAAEFAADSPKTVFLVRLNNKSLLAAETVTALVAEIKAGFPDLLVLWENERAL